MNATFAWQLGLAEGTFRAAVLAGASIGAAILAPLSFVAVTVALRRWQFGTALLALVPGLGCVSYTAASSLGFIASSRDAGIGAQLAISENRDDIRARREAALAELRLLKGQAPRILERRRALMADLAELSKERQAQPHQHQPDSQAKALAFYLTAAGYPVTTEAVGVWLSLAMTIGLELFAAFSLTIAAPPSWTRANTTRRQRTNSETGGAPRCGS